MAQIDHKAKAHVAEQADNRRMMAHERPKLHAWRAIGRDWYYCNGCGAWRHKDVLDMMKWAHQR